MRAFFACALLVASSVLGSVAVAETAAPPAATPSSSVVLVPFGPPGNTDYQLDAATNDFSTRLTGKRSLTVHLSKPMDAMDVAGNAADLCKTYDATSIFIGTVRHEQTHNVFWGTYPTHAEVRVSQLSCDGKVKWKGVGVGDKTQYWSNPAAAVTNVIQMALDQIIGQMSS